MKCFLSLLISVLVLTSSSFAQEFEAEKGALKEIKVFNGADYDVFSLQPLSLASVSVTSTLKSKSDRYDKKNLTDGDEQTAWVEGVAGTGKGERITFTFADLLPPDVIEIVPGYNTSESTWFKNCRVAKFKVRLLTHADAEEPNSVLDEITVSIPLNKGGAVDPGKYAVNISSLFLQHMGYTEFGSIELELLEIDNKGAAYDDTCISEIRFFVGE